MDDTGQRSPFAQEQRKMSQRIYRDVERVESSDWRCSANIPEAVALGIYQQNLHGGVARHLQAHFPVTLDYVGTQAYQFICGEYLKASPPEQPVFTMYAAHFPGFMLEYSEQNTRQPIWCVAAHLAQIDFFHHNTHCANQSIVVDSGYYQLWRELASIVEANNELTDVHHGLYRRPELHPEHYLQAGESVQLVTFRDNGELFFRAEPV